MIARVRVWLDRRTTPTNPLTAMAAGIAATGGSHE